MKHVAVLRFWRGSQVVMRSPGCWGGYTLRNKPMGMGVGWEGSCGVPQSFKEHSIGQISGILPGMLASWSEFIKVQEKSCGALIKPLFLPRSFTYYPHQNLTERMGERKEEEDDEGNEEERKRGNGRKKVKKFHLLRKKSSWLNFFHDMYLYVLDNKHGSSECVSHWH